MNRTRPDRNIAARASELSLLVGTILVLFPSTSAAQNNSAYETDVRPTTTSPTLVSARSQPFKIYHDGSIRDISSVGNRDIGCTHGLGHRYSLQAQIEMGRTYAQRVESTFKLITDPIITEYVNRIGQNLALNSDSQVQNTFKIIDTDEVTAFSLPGDFIFVDSGLILAADDEAELAGVISHEMAHVAACHVTQEMARDELSNVSSMPLIFRLLFRPAIRNTVYLKSIPSFEFEADLLGVEYLYKAGYDPEALPSLLEKMSTLEKQNGTRADVLVSYPQIAERIRRIQHEIDTLLPPVAERKRDTLEFQETKKRLAGLKNRAKVNNAHDGDRPMLSGASTPPFIIEFDGRRNQ